MPRYFFNLVGEHAVQDPDGLDLPDIATARLHAMELAQALMRRTRVFRDAPALWSMQLIDDAGREVAVIPFRESATFSMNGAEKHGCAATGRLGWNVQLHLGREIANADRGFIGGELPDALNRLLMRLVQATTDKATSTNDDQS
jgi:hypothetical protein